MSEETTVKAVAKLAKLQTEGGPDIDPMIVLCEEIDWELINKALALYSGTCSEGYRALCERHEGEYDHHYQSAAGTFYHKCDELELDDLSIVSVSYDNGAYVQMWRWVSDEEAGIERCSECGEILPEAGDGENGLCAECADKKENSDGEVL